MRSTARAQKIIGLNMCAYTQFFGRKNWGGTERQSEGGTVKSLFISPDEMKIEFWCNVGQSPKTQSREGAENFLPP